MNKLQLIGSGGGSKKSGSSRTPVEDPDSLHSHQYAQVLDLISEGPIRGLVNGLRSVYLDETPIVAADGSSNFSGVTVEMRHGANNQTPVDGFATVDNEINVGVEIQHGTPVVRTITGEIDSATLTIGVPQLTATDVRTGDIHGTSVSLTFELQNNGGGFQPIPFGFAWSGDGSAGVSGNTVSRGDCYGIGITFTVTAGASSYYYDGASDYSGSDGGSGYGGGYAGGNNEGDASGDGTTGNGWA